MRRLATFAVLLVAIAAQAADKVATFNAPPEKVFAAAVRAAQKNWSVKFADEKNGALSFTTGTSVTTWGMDCSALIQPTKDGTRVSLRTQKHMQVYAWSAGDRIAKKFFAAITEELKEPVGK